ncbi:hypothetical protein [Streptomyces sp. NPDC001833]|uniref:hypothetical protein n=1 Tax=Streptomyces sp. NPDC001833 TaxID=3154658 RepID=UPI00331BF1D7
MTDVAADVIAHCSSSTVSAPAVRGGLSENNLQERHTPMARTIRLPLRMIRRPNALAEVIAAAALTEQTDIPDADGQLTFPFLLQEGG